MDGDILPYGHGIQVGFGVLAYGHGVIHMSTVVVIVGSGCTAITNGEVMRPYSFQLGYVDGIGVFGTGSQACDLTGTLFMSRIISSDTIRVTNGYSAQCRFPYFIGICAFRQVSLHTGCGIRRRFAP